MEDLSARLEKLLTEAEDCDLIGKLATDLKKRALFQKLASDLRSMAREVEAMIADRRTKFHRFRTEQNRGSIVL
jgi:hypothetical protein